jgi:hypothetical protein
VLIRELTRRFGRGWPTMLVLATAAGLIQAGLIDQSLFNHHFESFGDYWTGLPTRIPIADIDLSQLVVFVGGHVIWSFGAPIAVIESCAPRTADRPWLGRAATVVFGVLYFAVSTFFVRELVIRVDYHAAPARLIGTAVLAAGLIVGAFLLPAGRRATAGRRAPAPWIVGLVGCAGMIGHILLRDSLPSAIAWPGTLASIAILVVLAILVWRWSGRPGWSPRHVLVLAASPLLLYALLSYAVDPMGAPMRTKIISSTVVLAGMIVLLAGAYLLAGRGSTDLEHDLADHPA